MSGISSENPSLDLVLCMEYIWSAYEVIGDATRKIGAAWLITVDRKPNMVRDGRSV